MVSIVVIAVTKLTAVTDPGCELCHKETDIGFGNPYLSVVHEPTYVSN
jgi:hypothetical protein